MRTHTSGCARTLWFDLTPKERHRLAEDECYFRPLKNKPHSAFRKLLCNIPKLSQMPHWTGTGPVGCREGLGSSVKGRGWVSSHSLDGIPERGCGEDPQPLRRNEHGGAQAREPSTERGLQLCGPPPQPGSDEKAAPQEPIRIFNYVLKCLLCAWDSTGR